MREEKEEAKKEVEGSVFNRLYDATMKNEWEQVAKILKDEEVDHAIKLTKSLDTALHVAINCYHPESPSSSSALIERIITVMQDKGTLQRVLVAQNQRGDTPLHLAAALGWLSIFKTAIDKKYLSALKIRNSMGETPFFVAALHGRTNIFQLLHTETETDTSDTDTSHTRREDGNTILHMAVFEENFELASEILDCYPKLVKLINVDGESPLHVLAKKQNVFKSSSHLRLYDTIIYHCVFVDKLVTKKEINDSTVAKKEINDSTVEISKSKYPENYATCATMIACLRSMIKTITGCISKNPCRPTCQIDEENQYHQQNTRQAQSPGDSSQAQGSVSSAAAKEENRHTSFHDFFPANYVTCVDLFKFAMKAILVVLGVGFWRIQKIRQKKQRYLNALAVLDKMLKDESTYKFDHDGGGQQPQIDGREDSTIKIPKAPPVFDAEDDETSSSKHSPSQSKKNAGNNEGRKAEKDESEGFTKNDSPVVVAAKMGILEMVKRIRNKCPVAIQDLDSHDKNVIMLAAQHRHTAVFDYLCRDANLPEYMFHHFDKDGNSILHLAANLADVELYPWRIPGAALQMQWEMKWYKHVKESISRQSISHPNKKGKTPRNIFSVTHRDLKKAGSEWLIKTSESCSVVAALIAAVAFATSSTVPGGLNQEHGKPVLQHEKPFDVFAIASLVALCLSVTALVFFLAIITSRCEERDFKKNLPSKLLAGLSALFASIAAILLSFCSGHIFVLREELKFAVIPIYGSITIPVAFFVIGQLPLYFDLLRAAYTKVPLRSYKAFSY